MKNVTERTSNPFGMRAPTLVPDGRSAVYGYGDANADFHVVGDYPGAHGGAETGVPFTGADGGRRLRRVLHEVGLLDDPESDEPRVHNLFLSYLHASVTPDGREPTAAEYAELEPFFDAELRAIAAHVLLPVGDRAFEYVRRHYTALGPDVGDAAANHARDLKGSGFLVVPVADPETWDDDEAAQLRDTLAGLLASDYRQISDLGRFMADDEPYFVR